MQRNSTHTFHCSVGLFGGFHHGHRLVRLLLKQTYGQASMVTRALMTLQLGQWSDLTLNRSWASTVCHKGASAPSADIALMLWPKWLVLVGIIWNPRRMRLTQHVFPQRAPVSGSVSTRPAGRLSVSHASACQAAQTLTHPCSPSLIVVVQHPIGSAGIVLSDYYSNRPMARRVWSHEHS